MLQMREAAIMRGNSRNGQHNAGHPGENEPVRLNVEDAAEDFPADGGGGEDSGNVTHDGGSQAQGGGFGNKEGGDLALRPADGFENADLLRTLDHHLGEVAADAERSDTEDEQGQQKERGAEFQHHIRLGGGDSENSAHVGRGKLRGQRGPDRVHTISRSTYFDETRGVLGSGQGGGRFEGNQQLAVFRAARGNDSF